MKETKALEVQPPKPLEWPVKDPRETLDFDVFWVAELQGEIIAQSEWEVPSALEQTAASFSDTATKIWLKGGTAGRLYGVGNKVTTNTGQVHFRTVMLPVQNK